MASSDSTTRLLTLLDQESGLESQARDTAKKILVNQRDTVSNLDQRATFWREYTDSNFKVVANGSTCTKGSCKSSSLGHCCTMVAIIILVALTLVYALFLKLLFIL